MKNNNNSKKVTTNKKTEEKKYFSPKRFQKVYKPTDDKGEKRNVWLDFITEITSLSTEFVKIMCPSGSTDKITKEEITAHFMECDDIKKEIIRNIGYILEDVYSGFKFDFRINADFISLNTSDHIGFTARELPNGELSVHVALFGNPQMYNVRMLMLRDSYGYIEFKEEKTRN